MAEAQRKITGSPARRLFNHKRIKLRAQRWEQAESIAERYDLSPVAARVLAARGYSTHEEELEHFVNPTLRSGLPSPGKLKGLAAGAELVRKVVDAGGSVAICCDFDVDGLSGGAQLAYFFDELNIPHDVFVPDRFIDGYGLNEKTVRKIAAQGFALLICVDYGTTNIKELSLAHELGLKTIVIDHHHVGETLPPTDVLINPQQSGCGFAGGILSASGLAWYFLAGLKPALKGTAKIEVKSYLDLACLGTICDMVPLTGANRIIAKRGLEALQHTKREGLRALKNVIGISKEVTCSHISFGIGPRINAAGRIVHGEVVIKLLTSNDAEFSGKVARKLNMLNQERQEIEVEMKERAVRKVEAFGELPRGIVLWEKDFHTGVIGLIAQRLVESFYRPSAVMGCDTDGIFKGSVRGVRGFSVVDALTSVSAYLEKFGGHEGAGGFSVKEKNVEEFAEAFIKECKKRLEKCDDVASVEADTEAELKDIDVELVKELRTFAPFGMGNPSPLLLLKNMRVIDLKILKDTHLKCMLSDGQRFISGFLWRQTEHPALSVGCKVKVAAKVDCNEFRGATELQLNLEAVEAV